MTQPTEQDRQEFESWVSRSPYEYSIDRYPDSAAFPGTYKSIRVDLAWHAWQEAQAKMQSRVAELEAICENVPEGCTPADARVLREANHRLIAEVVNLEKRAAIRGELCRATLKSKAEIEKERDGLAAKCAERERYNVQSIANRICGEIPDEFHIEMVLESGAGWVSLFHKGKPVEIDMADWGIAEQFDVAMQCVQQIEREGGV